MKPGWPGLLVSNQEFPNEALGRSRHRTERSGALALNALGAGDEVLQRRCLDQELGDDALASSPRAQVRPGRRGRPLSRRRSDCLPGGMFGDVRRDRK